MRRTVTSQGTRGPARFVYWPSADGCTLRCAALVGYSGNYLGAARAGGPIRETGSYDAYPSDVVT